MLFLRHWNIRQVGSFKGLGSYFYLSWHTCVICAVFLCPFSYSQTNKNTPPNTNTYNTTLHLYKERLKLEEEQSQIPLISTLSVDIVSDYHSAKFIEKVLNAHLAFDDAQIYDKKIYEQTHAMSRYYAQFSEVVALFKELESAHWSLKYSPNLFQTKINGDRLTVENVEIFFDPYSAAKLKFYSRCNEKPSFCIASPADALLHELLHATSILGHTEQFISQGGMGTHFYPKEHESYIIKQENALYKAMTKVDGKPRPIRSEHRGRHLESSCVTCLH